MQKKTNTAAVVLGITTGVLAISTIYLLMQHSKVKKAIEEANMEIDEQGKLVSRG